MLDVGCSQGSWGGRSLDGERIFIATGSSPLRPALFPFGSPEIYDSDTILFLDGFRTGLTGALSSRTVWPLETIG